MSPELLIARCAARLELTLHRPDRRNALSAALIRALTETLHTAARDDTLRCVILTGSPPAFCSGMDLRELDAALATDSSVDTTPLLELYEAIERCPHPVIAAVNGPAMAGGAGLVTCSDLAIFARSATFGYPGIRRGHVAGVVLPSLLRAVGERHAAHLLLTGDTLDADACLRIGVAHEVVDDQHRLPRVREIADHFAQLPGRVVSETKALLLRWNDASSSALTDARRGLAQRLRRVDGA